MTDGLGTDELLDEAVAAFRAQTRSCSDGEATLGAVLHSLEPSDALDGLLDEAVEAWREAHPTPDAATTLARIQASLGKVDRPSPVTEEVPPETSSTVPANETPPSPSRSARADVLEEATSAYRDSLVRRRWWRGSHHRRWLAAAAALLALGLGVPTTWAWSTGRLPRLLARVGLIGLAGEAADESVVLHKSSAGRRRPARVGASEGRGAEVGAGAPEAPFLPDAERHEAAASQAGRSMPAAASDATHPSAEPGAVSDRDGNGTGVSGSPVAAAGASGERRRPRASGSSSEPAAGGSSEGSAAGAGTGRVDPAPLGPGSRAASASSVARAGASPTSGSVLGDSEPRGVPDDGLSPTARAAGTTSTDGAPASSNDAESRLFAEAHRAHFGGAGPAVALAAWDRYLAAHPDGRYQLEARYNRALCLVRVERLREAMEALRPFADGVGGGYRRSEARTLLDALSTRIDASRGSDARGSPPSRLNGAGPSGHDSPR